MPLQSPPTRNRCPHVHQRQRRQSPPPRSHRFQLQPAQDPGDWVYWQQFATTQPIRNLVDSPIGQYLGRTLPSVLHCPSDWANLQRPGNPADTGANNWGDGQYIYSYVLNGAMTSYPGGFGCPAGISPAIHLSSVRSPAMKILLFEEDPSTIDDGNGIPFWLGTPAAARLPNLLSNRHDTVAAKSAGWDGIAGDVPAPKSRGNVAFCDGHAEFIPRSMIHELDNRYTDPFFRQ